MTKDNTLKQIIEEIISPLLELEAHHVELNRLAGREESHSKTLRLVRIAIEKVNGLW